MEPKPLLNHAREMRRIATPPEQKLWRALRNRGLGNLKFRRQVPFGPFILDFFCEDTRLVVEIDGATHATPNHDADRNAWLTAHGCTIIRFWNNDVMANLDGVLHAILAASPSPSPSGRGPG